MNLQIKHLIYQNFNPLRVYFSKDDIDIILEIEYCNGIISFLNRNESYLLNKNPFKLILKPISDLDKLIRNEFEKYDSKEKYDQEIINIFCNENVIKENIDNMNLSKLPYDCIEYIFKNHYDFFGLIKKGLAVDLNDIQ